MSPSTPHPAEEPLSTAVVTAVAERRGVEPTELPQKLYDVLDPDALDSLFADGQTTAGTVTFAYCGYTVTVTANGEVTLDD